MLERIRGLRGWRCKDCKVIYRLWRWKIVKQDESNGDVEFIMTIGLGGKSTSYWKSNKRQFWEWKGICKAYKNPILKFDVGQASFENRKKACGAQVVSTTRSGVVGCMNWGGFQKRHSSRWRSP
jgi:hypothetical protein